MPTTNPRVNVTLSPSLDALVGAMARHQRASKSQVLRELLEAAEPALRRAVALMDAASRAHGDLLGGLERSLQAAQDRAETDLAAGLARLESISTDLVSAAEAVRSKRPARTRHAAARAASVPRDPPPSKRGVKSPKGGRS